MAHNPIIYAIVRTKTLHVLRQFSSTRAGQVLRFLLDARQLTINNNPLDLSTAKFDSIDYSHNNLQNISLCGVSLSHALFNQAQLIELNLKETTLHYTNFSRANINKTDFSFSSIHNADFSFTKLIEPNFAHVSLINTTFIKSHIEFGLVFNTHLTEVNFDSSVINKSQFYKAITNDQVRHQKFFSAASTSTILNNGDFRNVTFYASHLHNVSFINASFEDATGLFMYTHLTNVNFYQVKDISIDALVGKTFHLENITLPNGTLYTYFNFYYSSL